MDFEIVFYKDSSGKSPVEEFLDDLEKINQPLYDKTLKGLEKLKNKAYHREPLSKYLEQGLWELRIRSEKNIVRIIYAFDKGQIIILLHAFVKKDQKTPKRELEMGRKRLANLKVRKIN
ncbi:type II toxin-antitoxin system RelE/ParE family toxin [Candidatus Curtissbacteria bacterium]|nr:type II toxin-antitoxin system RelE/ParE family toxin [Candidatus Curtissbacteria bacterium]